MELVSVALSIRVVSDGVLLFRKFNRRTRVTESGSAFSCLCIGRRRVGVLQKIGGRWVCCLSGLHAVTDLG
jgi:hypothetical protein